MGRRSSDGAGQQKSVKISMAWGHSPSEGTGREDDALGGTAMGMGAALGTGTTAIQAREHHVEAMARNRGTLPVSEGR